MCRYGRLLCLAVSTIPGQPYCYVPLLVEYNPPTLQLVNLFDEEQPKAFLWHNVNKRQPMEEGTANRSVRRLKKLHIPQPVCTIQRVRLVK